MQKTFSPEPGSKTPGPSQVKYSVRTFAMTIAWLVGLVSITIAEAEPVALVSNSQAVAVIVLPPEADQHEQQAARELQNHIRMISGAELAIDQTMPTDENALILGRAAPADFLEELRQQSSVDASFRILAEGQTITIAGLESVGTLYGAYELLEQLGVRWFMPDAIGRVVPSASNLLIASQDRLEIPSFAGRQLQAISDMGHTGGREWAARMRLSGFNAGSHGLAMSRQPDRETEGDMYMIEDGRQTGKVRVNHPETIRRTIEGVKQRLDQGRYSYHDGVRYVNMGPHDGLGFGEDPWDADDMDPLHGRISVTDRYIKFFNLILEEIADEYPDAGIAFYCYSQHMRAPVREKPHPNILPVLAPIDVCRFHSIDNPLCWERQYIRQVVDDWQALGTRMMYRGYIFNLADPSMPFSMIRQTADELPYYHQAGMFASRIETKAAWGYHAPSFYLAARMMWDIEVDVESVLQDYFDGLYGPAASPMRQHFEILEDAFEQADYHTGNIFDFPHILTSDVMAAMDRELSRAEQLAAGHQARAERVAMVRMAFDYGTTMFEMLEAINDFDFVKANQALDRLYDELVPPAVEYDPPILSRRYVPRFIDRFWRDMVRQGHARVTDGNRIISRLPDQWMVMFDPYNGGEALGLWKPELGTNSWTPLNTYSQAWSNQGLRYFKGVNAIIWYRTSFPVPAEIDPEDDIFLWLGSVDNRVENAWINGQRLRRLRSGSAPVGRPWEFSASGVLKPGEDNVIVLHVANDVHRELGTGGLTAPAMLWRAEQIDRAAMEEAQAPDPLDFLPGQ